MIPQLLEMMMRALKRLPAVGRRGAIAALAGLMSASIDAHAGSIEYLTNLSADYIRTFSRNAVTDGVDSAVYNPAGAAFLKDEGLYLGVSTQTLFGEYSIEDDGVKYAADIFAPVVPSLHLPTRGLVKDQILLQGLV